jgi:S-formylglutathione hydrolase FrmB
MGGHGAFYLAIRHPDVFGAAGSISGGLDIRPFPGEWDLNQRLGDPKRKAENWEKHTVINLVEAIDDTGPKLFFDCGTEDFFFDVNNAFHGELLERGIPHDYTIRPGGHDDDYWTESIPYHLLFFDAFFDNAASMEE